MRLLITGASGVLGRAVLRAAGEAGGITAVAASRTPGPGAVRIELEEPASVRAAVAAARPDAVLHAAAMSAPTEAEADPGRAMRVNRDGTAHLAAACRERGVALAVVSTDLVFPGRDGGGYREEDRPHPLGAYASSKLAGEEAALAAHPGALVVRTSLLLGPLPHGHVGRLARDLACDGAVLFTDERRSPVLAIDLARALLELLARGARGLLHLAGPEGMSRHELGLRIARGLGLDASRIRPGLRASAPPPPRPGDVTLASDRAVALLQATRVRRIDEGMGELRGE